MANTARMPKILVLIFICPNIVHTFRQDFFAQMRELFCRLLYFIGYLRPNLSGLAPLLWSPGIL